MNYYEGTQLLRLLEYFEDLFDGTLGDRDTVSVDLELKPGSKPFNSKYYMVPRINKENFCKELKCLVELGMLTSVQFKDLFAVNLWYWATEPVDLDLKQGSERFNSKYYPAPRINKENFFKELKHVVEIGVLTPVQ